MRTQLLTLLTAAALAGSISACKDRRAEYGEPTAKPATPAQTPAETPAGTAADDTRGGTTNAVTPTPMNPEGSMAKRDIDNAQSTFNVDITNADAIAHFNSSGRNDLQGIAKIEKGQFVVAVTGAKPGKYAVQLAPQPSCETSGSVVGTPGDPANRSSVNVPGYNERTGGAADRLGPNDTSATKEDTQGDHTLGFLVVGQDGQGRLEANINAALVADKDRLDQETIVIKSLEGDNVSQAQLRGPIACAELNEAEHGA